MKRFWTDVAVDADGTIRLDDRPVRTPGRVPLTLPTPALAAAVAAEWHGVGETLDPRTMPLTGLANASIDRVAVDPATFAADLARYGESDLLYYRADGPRELIARQEAAWNPLLDWAARRYDIAFAPTSGVTFRAQPDATVARLHEALAQHDPFALAALSPIVSITGTLVGALALVEGATSAGALWDASQVDEAWQAEHWGADDLALAATAARRRDYDAASAFLDMARG